MYPQGAGSKILKISKMSLGKLATVPGAAKTEMKSAGPGKFDSLIHSSCAAPTTGRPVFIYLGIK